MACIKIKLCKVLHVKLGMLKSRSSHEQGSGNFEIWIGPADDDDVINEPISKKKYIYMYV